MPAPGSDDALLDVTPAGQASQSSAFQAWGDAGAALRGDPQGLFSFHTAFEDAPWWQLAWDATVPVARIQLWNRNDEGLFGAERAVPLRVLLAPAADAPWREAARIGFVFGGVRMGGPLTLDLAEPIPARRLRLQVDRHSALHLDKVRVFAGAPGLPFARAAALRREADGSYSAALVLRHDAGFFSVCTTALSSVLDLHRCGIRTRGIDGSAVFADFRDPGAPGDVYRRLFEPDAGVALPARPVVFSATRDNHGRYRELDFGALVPFVRRHFMPAAPVRQRQRDLLGRHGLDPARLVGLWYRGTDKHTEVAPADIQDYIALAERLLGADPALRLLVQTDQAQIRDAVVGHFGPRCVYFDEMPVTAGGTAVHRQDIAREYGMSRGDFASTLLACVGVLARCRQLITHTGNIGLWLALYRGSAAGLHQFDSSRALVPPPG